jgi:hypothetical protein
VVRGNQGFVVLEEEGGGYLGSVTRGLDWTKSGEEDRGWRIEELTLRERALWVYWHFLHPSLDSPLDEHLAGRLLF